MTDLPWEEIDHTADWAIRVWGKDRRALYENAARGMVWLLGEESYPATISHREHISVEGSDAEVLMVRWLTELLYLIEEEMMPGEIRVTHADSILLRAEVGSGPPAAPPNKHIKAVTYHNLAVREVKGGWEAELLFDV